MADKMTEVFLDEANDLLDKLEDLLLELEDNPTDEETIQAIFRSMHTIKGSSAMFGFEEISRFTHEIETAFDEVRNGRVKVANALISITLNTRDHIRNLLDDQYSPELKVESENLINEIKLYVQQNTLGDAQNSSDSAADSSTVEQKPQPAQSHDDLEVEEVTWRVTFMPAIGIFSNGTNINGLLSELEGLASYYSVTVLADKIPPITEIDYQKCYVRWEIILTTTKGKNEIEDVFIFLDSDSIVEVTQLATEDSIEDDSQKKLGEILIEKRVVTETEINEVMREKKPIGEILHETIGVSHDAIEAALAEQQHLKEVRQKKQQESNTQTIKVNSDKLDRLIDLVGELVTFNARLGQQSQVLQNTGFSTLCEQGERLILELRDTTMDMRMLPIGTIFSRFRRLVRDLSGELKKDIELITEGADTELDKTVIEKLNDPLVHLIRNSIDHGVEMPDVRIASGKARQGIIKLKAQHIGAFVLINIEDDGAGLNKERIMQKAIERNLIAPNAELSDQEICDLIFLPGFSTAASVTSVSGRGVGMDVVKKDIAALGGTVSVTTTPGKGSVFSLKIPLTLAIIEGILVKIGETSFVIPLSNVVECLEFRPEENDRICSSINIRGEVVPYINLRSFFDITDKRPSVEQIVIVNDQDSRIGLVIDKVIGNYQTVIKPLGKLYKQDSGFSGATILGDGSVALILDIFKLSDVIREVDSMVAQEVL